MITETPQTPRKNLLWLTLGALGVVFGDIGTSPLYAVNQIFFSHHGIEVTRAHVLGCISLVLWALGIVVALKYILLVLRADNDGQGGVFALYGLLHQQRSHRKIFGIQGVLWMLILAAGLLFGDGMITPAISVLSAVEGLKVATPIFNPYIVPLTLLILTVLFAMQSRGTAVIGSAFGPIIVVWFIAIGAFGAKAIFDFPDILNALNPWHAVEFLMDGSTRAILIVFGGVILAIAGSEALFADLGHFGKEPIRLSWFLLVFPALILNYLGQGAYLLSGQEIGGENLFYSLVPKFALFPMVILATAAAVIASQALLSGVFSLTSQAIGLGLFPRLKIVHTHQDYEGQIYSPFINWVLYVGCVLLVLGFTSSNSLASAYGLAEAGVMLSTSIAMAGIACFYWKWSLGKSTVIFGLFGLMDLALLLSNSFKIFEGGFIPLSIGAVVFMVMVSWRWGRKSTADAYARFKTMSVGELIELKKSAVILPERNAVLMSNRAIHSVDENTPPLLQFLWTRHGLLPKNLIFVEVVHRKIPYFHGERCEVRVLQRSAEYGAIFSVTMMFGFMEVPNVESVLESLALHHDIVLDPAPDKWVVHVSQENLIPFKKLTLFGLIRFRIFSVLRQISTPGYYYYGLGDRVQLSVEIFPVKLH